IVKTRRLKATDREFIKRGRKDCVATFDAPYLSCGASWNAGRTRRFYCALTPPRALDRRLPGPWRMQHKNHQLNYD
ncbi:MAG: hypothetical protein WCC42_16380, partial [Pseudolabrys sp.]